MLVKRISCGGATKLFSDSARYASTDAADGRIVFSDIELVGLEHRTKLHRAVMRTTIFGTPHGRPIFGATQHPDVLRSTVTTWQEQSKERKLCPDSQGNFRIIENITADVEIWPYLMGPNFGQQNVVKTHNTCVVISQILYYVQRVLIRVVRCTLYVAHTYGQARNHAASKRTQPAASPCIPLGRMEACRSIHNPIKPIKPKTFNTINKIAEITETRSPKQAYAGYAPMSNFWVYSMMN